MNRIRSFFGGIWTVVSSAFGMIVSLGRAIAAAIAQAAGYTATKFVSGVRRTHISVEDIGLTIMFSIVVSVVYLPATLASVALAFIAYQLTGYIGLALIYIAGAIAYKRYSHEAKSQQVVLDGLMEQETFNRGWLAWSSIMLHRPVTLLILSAKAQLASLMPAKAKEEDGDAETPEDSMVTA